MFAASFQRFSAPPFAALLTVAPRENADTAALA